LRGLFVTGTDTGVGKTVLAAAIVAALRAEGVGVTVLKPVMTGLDEPAPRHWPHDHELLARVAGRQPAEVGLVGYGPAVSPHLAGELSGRTISGDDVERVIRDAAADAEIVVVEGVGGLLVPLSEGYDVRALAAGLGMPLVIAARPGLGTINHTLLTLEAARAAGLEVAAVVLTPWPRQPGAIERSNRETIERLGVVDVAVLGRVPRAEPELLARAGRALPLERWLAAAR
jgi:dethiobiotin synthetase